MGETRRRGEALVGAIHAAVLAELGEVGYAGLTMEGVAERAGAGKASLYRRWGSKPELVRDTAYALMRDGEGVPDTGSLREDLCALLGRTAELLSGPLGEAMRGVLSEALVDPGELSQGMGRRMTREVVLRGVQRGEISADAVTDLRLDIGQALLRDRLVFRRIQEVDVEEIVDSVLMPLFRGGTVVVERGSAASETKRSQVSEG
ncbi:TetR/AcrR family transcriptional regulator [Microbacterium sp. KUDC0406]|uniref:TetR/AcrR family transcriptional regulator n=1 Tax=Microbacterium sp. KUDC0406 TaxID=2909588 RepID=UPI001F41A57B|nr:TetR/AcrR family transcriptional regulator [Microbacterium sp. KUDC0406]UJP09544.1 TetR/AcrR family transcriptional regulator [Microbacterium sp. KUDC0406]